MERWLCPEGFRPKYHCDNRLHLNPSLHYFIHGEKAIKFTPQILNLLFFPLSQLIQLNESPIAMNIKRLH